MKLPFGSKLNHLCYSYRVHVQDTHTLFSLLLIHIHSASLKSKHFERRGERRGDKSHSRHLATMAHNPKETRDKHTYTHTYSQPTEIDMTIENRNWAHTIYTHCYSYSPGSVHIIAIHTAKHEYSQTGMPFSLSHIFLQPQRFGPSVNKHNLVKREMT